MDKTYILGHKNPDTDSICSAIAYADFKQKVFKGNFVPGRLGPISPETQFVLDYFNIPAPKLLKDVYTRLTDVKYDDAVKVGENASLFEVWNIMIKEHVRIVSVIDDRGRFVGLVTLGDIAKSNLETTGNFSKYKVPLENMVKALQGDKLFAAEDSFSGHVLVAAMETEQVEEHLKDDTLLITGNREKVMFKAIDQGINTLVITGDYMPPTSLMDFARARNVNLIVSSYDTFDTVKLINQSLPVHYVMKDKDLVTFERDDLIDDVREMTLRHKYRHFPVLASNKEPIGFLTRGHLLGAKGKKVILVDHNEKSQSAEGIHQAQVLEVIDHHRIATMETPDPIVFINRPVGSTATIIYSLYKEKDLVPSGEIAGIMCAAILSDTLVFKSPTCTGQDVAAAKELADLAQIDIDSFSRAMFKEGTSLEGKSPKEIFYTDFKDFSLGGQKIGVAQVNIYKTTLGPMQDQILKLMEGLKASQGYDLLLLMLTDIIDEGSEFLHVGGQEELLSRAFGIEIGSNKFYLPLVVSRKKQVIPRIISAIKQG